MQKQTEIYMKQNHMTRPGDGVLVGLSGGAESFAAIEKKYDDDDY